VRRLPDVIAAYRRVGGRYRRVGATGRMTSRERRWWRAHGQELVNTMAAPYGPDVVGLLRDETSYGVMGDHGGHQRRIQEIPIAFSWPGLRPATRGRAIRSVDILPTVLKAMGIRPDTRRPPDGRGISLRRRR
jgi:arylsulfatase A-like enzyme